MVAGDLALLASVGVATNVSFETDEQPPTSLIADELAAADSLNDATIEVADVVAEATAVPFQSDSGTLAAKPSSEGDGFNPENYGEKISHAEYTVLVATGKPLSSD